MATADLGFQSQHNNLGHQDQHNHNNHGHQQQQHHNDGDHHHTRAISQSTDSSKNGSHKVTYENPDADVALRSSDGRIFKVESYVLKAHSSFFRQKFKHEGISSSSIQVNANTKTLKSLLDIMHMRPVPSGMVWSNKDKLLKLCDDLGTPSVAERAVFSMHDNVHKDPWGIFCLASQRGNVSLAKAALKVLAEDDKGNKIERLTPQLAAGVTLPYLLGLFNAALKVRSQRCEGGEHDHGNVGWYSIAENFSPVVG